MEDTTFNRIARVYDGDVVQKLQELMKFPKTKPDGSLDQVAVSKWMDEYRLWNIDGWMNDLLRVSSSQEYMDAVDALHPQWRIRLEKNFDRTSKLREARRYRIDVWQDSRKYEEFPYTMVPVGQGVEAEVVKVCDGDICHILKAACTRYNECVRSGLNTNDVSVRETINTLVVSEIDTPNVVKAKKDLSFWDNDAVGYPWTLGVTNLLLEDAGPSFDDKHRDLLSLSADMESERSRENFAAALVQVVDALLRIQRRFPGFCHNDLNPTNVLLTNWGDDEDIPRYAFRDTSGSEVVYEVERTHPKAVIIDFSRATGLITEETTGRKTVEADAESLRAFFFFTPGPWVDMWKLMIGMFGRRGNSPDLEKLVREMYDDRFKVLNETPFRVSEYYMRFREFAEEDVEKMRSLVESEQIPSVEQWVAGGRSALFRPLERRYV